MPLRVTENGRLDPNAVNELSRDELRVWIRDRLHEEDTRVQDSPKQDIGQYYLLGSIYDEVESETQENIREILLGFLRQIKNETASWTGRPAHALLLLIMEIGAPELAGPIRRMAEAETAVERDEEDLHARFLQALVELGADMDADFWVRQMELDPVRYGVQTFAGLQRQNLYQAIGTVLSEINLADDDRSATFYSELRGLLASEQHTHDYLQFVIYDVLDTLPDDASELIRVALPELDLPNPTEEETDSPKAKDYGHLRAVLGQQGYPPHPDVGDPDSEIEEPFIEFAPTTRVDSGPVDVGQESPGMVDYNPHKALLRDHGYEPDSESLDYTEPA